MKKQTRKLEFANEEDVRLIAHIMGPGSAAAAALADLDLRRLSGESVTIFKAPGSWYVGPDPRKTEESAK